MADTKPAANGHSATIAALETRVSAFEINQARIERTILDLDSSFNSSITNLSNDFRSQLTALSAKLEAKNTTNWPVLISGLGALITIVTLLGTMAFLPVQRDTARLDTAVAAILDRGVFQREYAADETRTKEDLRTLRAELSTRITLPRYNADQERTTHALDEMRARFATKAEMEAVFRERQRQVDQDSVHIENVRTRTYDHFGRIAKTEQAVSDLERRFDAVSRRLAEFIRDTGRRPTPN